MIVYLELQKKPSGHLSECHKCGKQIGKGKDRWSFGSFGYKCSKAVHFHPSCFKEMIKKIIDKGEGRIDSNVV